MIFLSLSIVMFIDVAVCFMQGVDQGTVKQQKQYEFASGYRERCIHHPGFS